MRVSVFIYFSEPSKVCFLWALLDVFRDLSDCFWELAWMLLEAETVKQINCPGAPRGGQLVFGRFQRFAGIFRRLRGLLARTLLRDKTYQPRSTPYSEVPKVPRGGEYLKIQITAILSRVIFPPFLAASWCPVAASWAPLGAFLGPLGASWEPLGGLLRPLGGLLGPAWRSSFKKEGGPILLSPLRGEKNLLLTPLGPLLGCSWEP